MRLQRLLYFGGSGLPGQTSAGHLARSPGPPNRPLRKLAEQRLLAELKADLFDQERIAQFKQEVRKSLGEYRPVAPMGDRRSFQILSIAREHVTKTARVTTVLKLQLCCRLVMVR